MKAENLEKIISLINGSKEKICLFLGAGADISSGGKLFAEVKKDALNRFSAHNPNLLNASQIDHYFESTIDSVPQFHSREVLLEEIDKKSNVTISDGYKILVLMAKYGLIDAVVTTNFFDYLEKAQEEMRLNVFDGYSNNDTENTAISETYPKQTLYLKLHGDVNRRHVSHVTQDEIDNKSYPNPIEEKVLELLQNDLVIFVGYSGFDSILTNLVKSVVDKMKTVFWINPNYNDSSELVQILSNNMVYGQYPFDEFIIHLGLKTLNNICLDAQEPAFIYSWLKAKADESIFEFLYSKKINIERSEFYQLKKCHRIHLISGKAGMGKTYLIEYYIQQTSKCDMLYINLNYNADMPVIEKIVTTFGFQTDSPFALLYNLCGWYKKSKKYLKIIIDEIPDKYTCHMEELVTFIDAIKANKNIDFILATRGLSIREKLSLSLWGNDINFIEIGAFSDDEIRRLASSYNVHKYLSKITSSNLSIPIICDLAFSCMAESASTFENVFDTIELALADRIDVNPQTFRNNLIDIAQAEYKRELPEEESVRNLKDTALISSNSPYYFKHELFKSYYLSLYLFRNNTEKQFNRDILIQFLKKNQKPDGLFYNACIVHYTNLDIHGSFGEHLLEFNKILDICCTQTAIDFCKTCVFQFAITFPQIFCCTIEEIGLSLNQELITILLEGIQAIENDDIAYKALCVYQNNKDFAYEAIIYCIDRFCENAATQENDIKSIEYFNVYYNVVFSGSNTVKLYKLIYALMRTEMAGNKQCGYVDRIKELLRTIASDCSVKEFIKILQKYSYNILFNSGSDIEGAFCAIAYDPSLIELINEVLNGKTLTIEQYAYLIDITNDINNMCIFLLSNIIVMQSMINNKEVTLSVATQIVDMRNDLNPQNIDFLLSSVFMSLYYCNPQNRVDFVSFFENTYDKYETAFFNQPTRPREATKKKFSEEFNRIFEDGFNPLAFLFYTSNLENDEIRLHQYWSICEQLCCSGNINKILIVVHAIGQMISVFPNEGFKALKKVTQYQNHDIIRRGIIRVLQESITRYPLQTREFIKQNLDIDTIDLVQPYEKVKDMMIRSRTLEQLHWVRLLYAYKSTSNDIIKKILQSITKARSLSSFISILLNQGNIETKN